MRTGILRAAVVLVGSLCLQSITPCPGLPAEAFLLSSAAKPGTLSEVKASLEVGGDLNVNDQGQVKALKMSVVGTMHYAERLLAAPASSDGLRRSVRHYSRADAAIKVDSAGLQPMLRPERRLIAATWDGKAATVYSPSGSILRDELDLVELPGNSLLIDLLLPGKPVAAGDMWQHGDQLLAALLSLDAVSASDVQSVLSSIDSKLAQMELAGTVHGAVAGVATEIGLKARYTFDRIARRVTSLTLLIKEKRSIGHVGPGIDVTARLQMTITPLAKSAELTDAALAGLPLEPAPELLALAYESAAHGFHFGYDRRWHVITDEPEQVVLRLVDRGELVAQCNVAIPAKTEPGKPISLARFQADIQQALGRAFGRFVNASEGTTPGGHVIYRVTAVGEVSELPIQWNYHYIADPRGRQVVFAFTIEGQLVEAFAQSDLELAGSVEFLEPQKPATASAATPAKR